MGERQIISRRFDLAGWQPTTMLVCILCAIGVAMRLLWLDSLAGINGDEAWYGNTVLAIYRDGWSIPLTPNRSLPGPGQILYLLAVQPFSPKSVLLLRASTVLVSLAAIALAYKVASRLGSRPAGVIAALIMATLPFNIVYARIGWDPSYSGMMVLLACLLALRGRIFASTFVAMTAVLLHPVNVFALPFLWCVFAWDRYCRGGRERAAEQSLGYGIVLAPLVLFAFILSRLSRALENIAGEAAALDPDRFLAFASAVPKMFTGDTVFRDIVGDGLGNLVEPASVALMALFLIIVGLAIFRPSRQPRCRSWAGALTGLLLLVLAIYLFAGQQALKPGGERYGFVMIAPAAVTAALILDCAVGPIIAQFAASAVAAAMLAVTATYYFVPLRQGAPHAHPAYWTGAVEPKAAAAEQIRRTLFSQPTAVVVGEDYWLAQPVKYLADLPDVIQMNRAPPSFVVRPGQILLVYRGGALEAQLADMANAHMVWESGGMPETKRIRLWKISSPAVSGNR